MEAPSVRATSRARLFYFVSAFLIVAGFLTLNSAAVSMGLVLLMMVVGLRAYADYVASSAYGLSAEISHGELLDRRPVSVVVTLRNPYMLPLAFLEYSIRHSPYLKLAEGSRKGLLIVPGKGLAKVRLVFAGRVGKFTVGPVELVARDPFGLYRSDKIVLNVVAEIKIPPEISEAALRRLIAIARASGLARARSAGYGTEFRSVREYRPGDELKLIEWRKTAKLGKAVVREMEREIQQNVFFLLDATRPMLSGPYGLSMFEHMARVVASVSKHLLARGDSVGLVVYSGRGVLSTSRARRGASALAEIESLLASVSYEEEAEGVPREIAIEAALRALLKMLPRERNIVFIIALVDDEHYADKVADVAIKLRRTGNVVFVLNPIASSYELLGLPEWARAVYRVKARGLLVKQVELMKSLRRKGIASIMVAPLHAPPLIARLVEARRLR